MSEQKTTNPWDLPEWQQLQKEASEVTKISLRHLISSSNKKSDERNKNLLIQSNGITLDCTRQHARLSTFTKLLKLCEKVGLKEKINAMFSAQPINITEKRRVLHIALRAKKSDKIMVNNKNVVDDVHCVLQKIKTFSDKVRNAQLRGFTDKKLTNVISIGIGGSYLGCEFVYEALRTNNQCRNAAKNRQLRFFANIDPIGFQRAIEGLNPEETLVIVISKTFTTRETMMNTSLVRNWLLNAFGGNKDCLEKHFVAVSANSKLPNQKFNIKSENVFEFWDWVGGRYSVCSAVGMLPLSLHFGFDNMEQFLDGANAMDQEFKNKDFAHNLAVVLGAFGVWNSTFLGYQARALIPYCEALCRLPAHIQQLDMESNGKSVVVDGSAVPFKCGEIDFGEPGTNAQHSFFQLVHQGRTIPIDFIGFKKSQLESYEEVVKSKEMVEEIKNNHDELLSNMFAQCDALAIGKNKEEVVKELGDAIKGKEFIVGHKIFEGNKPSSLILFHNQLDAFECGRILSLFEHRTAVQGFLWNICSFDQWGVELGKQLAKKVKVSMENYRSKKVDAVTEYNFNTNFCLQEFLK